MAGAETPTSICNIALARCGAKEITSFENDQSREAVLCRRLFHPARRSVLVMHHWNCARRAVQLTQISAVTITPIFYTYAYTLPTDYLRMISVHPSDDPNAICEYAIQNANDADADLVLLADSNQVYIEYIFDNTDLTTYDQSLKDVLAFQLARDVCIALGKSASKYELNREELRRMLTIAKSIDGMQDFPKQLASGSWVKARYGLYTDQAIINEN